jgi:F0F1-type ATP synthase membrane subunit c/vacuolar-type H+-ATPase subunit K
MQDEDPGWPRLPNALLLLVPVLGQRGAASEPDGLLATRTVFLSFSVALVLFGVVLAFLDTPNGPVVPWLPLLIGIAIVSTVAERFAERPLDPSSDAALAESYRTRFFIRIAFAEAVALFGFVFQFTGGPRWIYYPAGAFALLVFWTRAAPTRRALARDQARLTEEHAARSLVAALRSARFTPPSSRRARGGAARDRG